MNWMNEWKRWKQSRTTITVVSIVAVTLSGCAQEIGFKAWTAPVDEHHESTSGKRVPLKCYFVNCAADTTEAQGS